MWHSSPAAENAEHVHCPKINYCLSVAADAAGVADEEEETSRIIKHLPSSCFVGEWGEWSACDATCRGPFHSPQRYRKRSPIVVEAVAEDPDCILEEKQSCGHSLEPCVGYCWTAEWTEWSSCSAVLSGGEISFSRRRYKPVLAGVDYCDMEAIQELQSCLRREESMHGHACLFVLA